MREEILNYQKTFYTNARKESSNAGVIVFGDEKDATKVHKFIDLLNHHKIEVHYLKEDFLKMEKHLKKNLAMSFQKIKSNID